MNSPAAPQNQLTELEMIHSNILRTAERVRGYCSRLDAKIAQLHVYEIPPTIQATMPEPPANFNAVTAINNAITALDEALDCLESPVNSLETL